MSGSRYVLDTNILLYLLGGRIRPVDIPEGELLVSFISELEVLGYPSLTGEEDAAARELLAAFSIIDIDSGLKDRTIEFRRQYRLKLPDAIIAATAARFGAILVTNDSDFSRIAEIEIRTVERI